MLGGALGQLFVDLDKIPEKKRSKYEQALHAELLELGHRLRPLAVGQAPGALASLEPLWTQATFSGNTLRAAIEQTPSMRVQIDLGPSDIIGLDCDNPDCPNKRQ